MFFGFILTYLANADFCCTKPCDFAPLCTSYGLPENITTTKYILEDGTEVLNPDTWGFYELVIGNPIAPGDLLFLIPYFHYAVCTVGGFRNKQCEDDLKSNATLTKTYSGGLMFCNDTNLHFLGYQNNVTCTNNATAFCYCNLYTVSPQMRIYVNDVPKIVAQALNGWWTDMYFIPGNGTNPEFYNLNPNYKRSLASESSNGQYFVTYENFNIKVLVDERSIGSVAIIQKGNSKEVWMLQNLENNYQIPSTSRILSEPLNIVILKDNELVYQGSFEIVGRSECSSPDCTFCLEAFENIWGCWSPTQRKTLFIILIVVFLLLFSKFQNLVYNTIFFVKFVGYYIILCPLWILLSCLSTPFVKDSKMWATKVISCLYRYFLKPSNEIKEMREALVETGLGDPKPAEMDKFVNQEPKKVQRPNKTVMVVEDTAPLNDTKDTSGGFRRADPTRFFTVLCLISIITPGMCCDSGLFISANSTSCTRISATSETCQMSLQFLTTLDLYGKTCFTLVDSSNRTLGTGSLTYETFSETIPLLTSYFTSDWDLQSSSVRRCEGGGGCTTSICNSVVSNQDKTANNHFSNVNITNFPGRVYCTKTQESIFESFCVISGLGCLFGAYSLLPKLPVIKVMDRSTPVFQSTMLLSIIFSDGNRYQQRFSLTNTQTVLGFKATVIGNFLTSPTTFQYNKIAQRDAAFKLINAAPQNTPTKAMLGDIQATSASSLFSGGQQAFAYDSSIISSSFTSNRYVFTPSTHGADYFNNGRFLPAIIEGTYWSISSGNLVGIRSNAPAVAVKIETVGNYTLTRNIDLVCPSTGAPYTVTGCYTCPMGSLLTLKIKSTCMPGIIRFQVDNPKITLRTTSTYINITESSYPIYFDTSDKISDFKLTLIGNAGTPSISIHYVASDYVPVINSTVLPPQLSPDVSPNKDNSLTDNLSGFDSFLDFFITDIPNFFDDMFSGLSDWWVYLVVAIIAAAIIFLIIMRFMRPKQVMNYKLA